MPSIPRRLWHGLEPIHAVTYFAPACLDSFNQAGLAGFWMGYFAGRAAPMGPVGPAIVEATFYNFAPGRIRRAIPDAWGRATPEAILGARSEGAAIALRQADPRLEAMARRLVPLLEPAARAARCPGRVLAAANQALDLPEDPVARLWQLTTTLREHRGDGHVAALVAHGIDGCEAHVLLAAADGLPPELFRTSRGWTEDDWAAASDRLAGRGLLDIDDDIDEGAGTARLTLEGATLRAVIEDQTDQAAAQPYRDGLTDAGLELLLTLAPAAGRAVTDAGVLIFPNPMGLPVRLPSQ